MTPTVHYWITYIAVCVCFLVLPSYCAYRLAGLIARVMSR